MQKIGELRVLGFDLFREKIDPLCTLRAASCINWLDRPAPSLGLIARIAPLRLKGLPGFAGFGDVFIFGELIKHVVEHATDVVLAIIHDPLRLFVPKYRHCNALVETWIRCFVSFPEKVKAVDWIRGLKRRARQYFPGWIAKRPTFLIPNGIDNCHADRFFESL